MKRDHSVRRLPEGVSSPYRKAHKVFRECPSPSEFLRPYGCSFKSGPSPLRFNDEDLFSDLPSKFKDKEKENGADDKK